MALKSEQKDSCTIIVLGEANVGKTSLINRFRNDQFQEQLLTTLGLDCTTKDIILKSGKKAVMKIYDTAGQERYRTITKSYYQKANGILLVYSVKDRDSFMRISDWITEIKEKAKEDVLVFLIGNKCDEENRREVTKKQGEDLSKKYNIPFYESSAKLDINVKNVFQELAEEAINKKINDDNAVDLSRPTLQKDPKKGGCCK